MTHKITQSPKCYFTAIDKNFRSQIDIGFGAWCFKSFSSYSNSISYKAYAKMNVGEKLTLFYELRQLASAFLLDDLNSRPSFEHSVSYLGLKAHYIKLVYHAYSKYYSLKRLLEDYPAETILFEKVSPPITNKEFFFWDSHALGYLSFLIAKRILKDKMKTFQSGSTSNLKSNVIKSLKKKRVVEKSLKIFINTRFNLYKDVKGIHPYLGIFLSSLSLLTRLYGRGNVLKPTTSVKRDKVLKRFEEFASIFKEIRPEYILINPDMDHAKEKTPSYSVLTPNFINNQKQSLIMAKQILKGKKISIIQHGACYDTLLFHYYKEQEMEWGGFISWGKNKNVNMETNKILDLPSPYLNSILNTYPEKSSIERKDILWLTGVHLKGGDGLNNYDGASALAFIERKKFLFNSLDHDVKNRLIYKRLDPDESFYDDPLLKKFDRSQIRVQSDNTVSIIRNSYITILDYYGTPLYELMAMNSPFLMGLLEYDESPLARYSDKAKSIFSKLIEEEVIFLEPNKLAEKLNKIKEIDVVDWWKKNSIQRTRKEFLSLFANSNPFLIPWIKAIMTKRI